MSPRSKAQFEELRDASRQKILEAALSLFGTKGYRSTSIADIVKSAGISKGLVYHYFESKEDLLRQLVDYLLETGKERMVGFIEQEEQQTQDDPKARLKFMLDLFFREMRENYHNWSLILNLSVQVHHFDFIHDIASEKMHGYVLLLKELFAELGYPHPEDEARIVGALFDGIALQYYVLNDEEYLNSIERAIYEKYELL